jgi:hypothetical protein
LFIKEGIRNPFLHRRAVENAEKGFYSLSGGTDREKVLMQTGMILGGLPEVL